MANPCDLVRKNFQKRFHKKKFHEYFQNRKKNLQKFQNRKKFSKTFSQKKISRIFSKQKKNSTGIPESQKKFWKNPGSTHF